MNEQEKTLDVKLANIQGDLKLANYKLDELMNRGLITEENFETHFRSCAEKNKAMMMSDAKFFWFKIGAVITIISTLVAGVTQLII